ncbi:hypothetical protein MCAP1_003045 [Malassezia caprae]|uniref:Uncharacterized protein n=1 Tax=Malassezia caprae TaxID=1381934 RepID=A0AAF0EDK5_9BASI|nr:hypothetical protein MCAP1_003045 [Malassezia caprae]
MSSVTSAIKDAILPSDSNKEAEVGAPEVSETTPTVADPGLVGRPEDEVVTEHTTVYTNATPDVLESSNHHVLTEAVPITHTPVPDYHESPRAAPPIMGGNLYSILAQTQPVSGAETQPVGEQSKEAQPSAPSAYASEVPSSEQAWHVQNTDAYTSAGAGAAAATTSSEAPAAPAGQGSLEDQFEPTNEQAWSVRGPASNVVSRGPHEHAEHLNAGAAGDVPVSSDKAATDKVAEAPGAAVDGVQDKAAAAPGQAKDTATGAASQAQGSTTGVASQAKDSATGAASQAKDTTTGAASQAKDKATGAVSQAKDTAKDTAEKPKKLGLVQKMKKALKIGKENK